MLSSLKERLPSFLFSFTILLLLVLINYFPITYVQKGLEFINNGLYDVRLKYLHRPLSAENNIAIIDIDDHSLKEIGRWPWPRKKIAQLVQKLYENQAAVVAFDMIFAEEEKNDVDTIIEEIAGRNGSNIEQELQQIKPLLDYDKELAKSLSLGESVLAFTFSNYGSSSGVLPPPIITKVNPQLNIPSFTDFLSNIEMMQKQAKATGFINALFDSDGIIRRSYLLLKYQDGLYPSLGLQAALTFLLQNKISLLTAFYGASEELEGIKLGNTIIPTGENGSVLIPFRGGAYTFPYLSAANVLQDTIPTEKIRNKLLFIGSSATGWSDLYSTAATSSMPGVEIHANIAAGILDQYFPYQPYWMQGANILAIFFLGLIYCILSSFFGPILNTIYFFLLALSVLFFDVWLWKNYFLVITSATPILALCVLYVCQQIFGYFFETRKKKELRQIFGQYVPNEYIEQLLHRSKELNLIGENKELTVLFSDIRDFTAISEKMQAPEIKKLLNEYLTPMSEIIFQNQGTIDKYIGDMIVAFWGAPIDNPEHSKKAIITALQMQKKLQEINARIKKEKNVHLRTGIGINTGLMNVGDMGSDYRKAYTVLGDPVNLGSRIESLTKVYHRNILINETSYEKTKEIFFFRMVDKVKVKGKEKATTIYEPICFKEEVSSEQQREIEKYHQALQKYFDKNWQEAKESFEKLISEYPDNKELYGIFLHRMQEKNFAPPQDWDGATILTEK